MPTLKELNEAHGRLNKLKGQRKCLIEGVVLNDDVASVSLNGVHVSVNGWLFNQLQESAIAYLTAEIDEIEDYFRGVGVQP
jgi:hypothetical protein